MFRFLFIYLLFLDKQIDGQTERRATDGQTGRWRDKCKDRQSNIHTDRQTDRQTEENNFDFSKLTKLTN